MDLKTGIYRYCNYQERCHQEVKNKLYELGANTTEVNELLAELIEANLLNEERYARAFARGKFRMKRWGKVKITQELKKNRVSDYCIKKGLSEIDAEDYWKTLLYLAEKKWTELRGERLLPVKKNKLYRYLAQKGYESALIQEAILSVSTPV